MFETIRQYIWTVEDMRIGRNRTREGRLPVATIFMVGFMAGMLVMNFGKSILLEKTGLLDEYTLYHMKDMTVDSNALFYYVLRSRLGEVLLLAVWSTTYLGIFVCGGTVFWYGICAGAFLAAAVIRYGLKGILLVLTGIFPQYLVYIPAFVLLLLWCRKIYRAIYLNRGIGSNADRTHFLPGCILQFALIIFAFAGGAMLESFLNPHLMSALLKIF